MKNNEVGRTCGTYRGEENCSLGFDGKNKGRWHRGRPRSKLENNNKKVLRVLGVWTRQICFRIAAGGKPCRTR